jgi:hypothetical protein
MQYIKNAKFCSPTKIRKIMTQEFTGYGEAKYEADAWWRRSVRRSFVGGVRRLFED